MHSGELVYLSSLTGKHVLCQLSLNLVVSGICVEVACSSSLFKQTFLKLMGHLQTCADLDDKHMVIYACLSDVMQQGNIQKMQSTWSDLFQNVQLCMRVNV